MVLLLPKVSSFGEEFGRAFGGGLGAGVSEGLQSRQQAKQLAQENAQIKKEYGIDLTGINNPEHRKAVLVSELQGRRKEDLNPLQQAQKELAEARTSQAKGQTGFFDQLMGQSNLQDPRQSSELSQNMQSESQQQIDPQNPKTWPIDFLKKAAGFKGQPGQTGVIGNIAQAELDRQEKEQGREFEKYKLGRHEETELSKPILLEMNQIRKNIPLQEQAILDIKEASPNVSALDYFADITGFEPLRSAEGAKLKTGIKDFFLSDLSRVGARPNQWIEQQLADALPKIGRSTEANLITAEGLQFKVDLAKKRVELIDKLSEEDRKKFGFVKGDIDSRAFKEMKKYTIDRQKELYDDIKKIKSQNKGKKNTFRMTSQDGSVYEVDSNDYDEAIEYGFKLSEEA